MKKIQKFFKTTLIGGIIVVLPFAIVIGGFAAIYAKIHAALSGLTGWISQRYDLAPLYGPLINLAVVAILLFGCFSLGLMVKTGIGRWMHHTLEDKFLKRLPGYKLIRDTAVQFLSESKSPFSSVCMANIFGNATRVTAFITDEHADGSFTVFVPTGPNPTSGNIYHLASQFVQPIDAPVEDAMRSILSCGAGSAALHSGAGGSD